MLSFNFFNIHIIQVEELKFPYREAICNLMYLAIGTRPDICFAASRCMEKPNRAHVNDVKRILRYLKGTADTGIFFKSKSCFDLCIYSDADYNKDVLKRRSTWGYAFLLGESIIRWTSQRQKAVLLSTTESEYMGV